MGEGLGEIDIIDRVAVILIVYDTCADIVALAVIEFIDAVAVEELLTETMFDKEGEPVEVAVCDVVKLIEGEAELDDALEIVGKFVKVAEDDGLEETEMAGRAVTVTVAD